MRCWSRALTKYAKGSDNRNLFHVSSNHFVVNQDGNYEASLRDPDAYIDWTQVVQVLMPIPPTQTPTCPICLAEPVAPKCTKCGHVYCYSCIMRHLSVAQDHNRRCPVCFEDIRERELRSVSFVMLETQSGAASPATERALGQGLNQLSGSHDAGGKADVSTEGKGQLELLMMHRNASTTLVLPAHIPLPSVLDADTGLRTACFPSVGDPEVRKYAKILLAPPIYVAESIYEKEAAEIEHLLHSGDRDLDALERKYMEMARDTSLGRAHAVLAPQQQQSETVGSQRVSGRPIPAKGKASRPSTPQSSFGSPPHAEGPALNPGDRIFHFYQAADGSHIYLHPLDIRILKQEFGDYALFPPKLSVRVHEYEEGSVNSDLRKRFRYLGHLPLGCDVTFAEVILDGIVSEETLAGFKKELGAREDRRKQKRRHEKEEEERQLREARRLQRIQSNRYSEGVTAPVTAVRLADLEEEEDHEPLFDMGDLDSALSTSPTYVTPTPTLSFARAISSPKIGTPEGSSAKPWGPASRSAGKGQPPPAEFAKGITIGHSMGTSSSRSRIWDDVDDIDDEAAGYVYHSSSRTPFGLLAEDYSSNWNVGLQQSEASNDGAQEGKKKGKAKKIVLVSNQGARRK